MDVLGKGEGGNAVDDAKVHRLGRPAHVGRHPVRGHSKDLRGGDGVDVHPIPEGLNHGLIPGHVGQQPQLDLGVVGVHQHPAGPGHKHGAHLRPQGGAHRDILQVGLGGGQPPGGGDGVLEAGVDAPVSGNDLAQALHIGGVELGQLSVLQHQRDNGVLILQLLQHLGVGGVPGLGLLHRGQPQLFKQNMAQLLGREDVELLPRLSINFLLGVRNAPGEHLAKPGQCPLVHQHPAPLHIGQHRAQGDLHLLEQLGQPQLVQLGGQLLVEGVNEGVVFIPFGLGLHLVGQGPEGLLILPGPGLLQLLSKILHG